MQTTMTVMAAEVTTVCGCLGTLHVFFTLQQQQHLHRPQKGAGQILYFPAQAEPDSTCIERAIRACPPNSSTIRATIDPKLMNL
jgi:hypothetical protein